MKIVLSKQIVNMSKLLLCLVVSTLAGPLPEDQALAETKDVEEDANSIDGLLSELRDSPVFPLLLNPFQITKLTCGSLITFYDTGATDATVSVDLCLTALIVAKVSILCNQSLNI